ncbi:adhesion protein FadA [Fusobacterium sp. PH5-44]|uniref:adhesion protein FadA n=1 Tax=unclassified Fusobacterium TaxID=2648384 RepID=UPI003D260023
MKKLLLLVLSLLVVSVSFTAEVDELFSKVSNLEDQFTALEAMDNARYEEERERAQVAAEELAQQKVMAAQINTRMNAVKNMKGDQYKELAARYNDALKEVQAQIKENEKIISDFAKVEATRNPVVKSTAKKAAKKTTKK